MSEPPRRTIVDEDAGEATVGWSHASHQVRVRSARAQPDEEARENVIDALREAARGPVRFAARVARLHRQDSLGLTIVLEVDDGEITAGRWKTMSSSPNQKGARWPR